MDKGWQGVADLGISLASNEFFITVLVPFLITFLAIFVNWIVQGGSLKKRHAMIGSDLVVCFFAIGAIHFFQTYRLYVVSGLDGRRMASLMLGSFVMLLVTIPALLGCVGMERASHLGETPDSWARVGIDLSVGAIPLAVAALALSA